MTKPSERALETIRTLPKMDRRQVMVLAPIIRALGFSGADLQELLQVSSAADAQALLTGSVPMPGRVFARVCEEINCHSDIMRKKRHFDAGSTLVRHPRSVWEGPHRIFTDGHKQTGRSIGSLLKALHRSEDTFRGVVQGKGPISIGILRDLVRAGEEAGVDPPGFQFLKDLLRTVPIGLRASEDWRVWKEQQKTHTIATIAEDINVTDTDHAFAVAFANAGLSSDLADVITGVSSLVEVAEAQGIDNEVFQNLVDGVVGPLPRQLEQILAHMRSIELDPVSQKTYEVMQQFSDEFCVNQVPEPVVEKRVKGRYLEVWIPGKSVKVGHKWYYLDSVGRRSAPQQIYLTLNGVRDALGFQWTPFLKILGLRSETVKAFKEGHGSTILNPAWVVGLITSLDSKLSVQLSIKQLFALKPLPVIKPAAEELELLFELGDTRTGLLWGMTVRAYIPVRSWFKRYYGITPDVVARIERGEIAVPLAVHNILMQRVKERLEQLTDPVLPRPYRSLLKRSAHQTVDLSKIDELNLPYMKWFTDQKEN